MQQCVEQAGLVVQSNQTFASCRLWSLLSNASSPTQSLGCPVSCCSCPAPLLSSHQWQVESPRPAFLLSPLPANCQLLIPTMSVVLLRSLFPKQLRTFSSKFVKANTLPEPTTIPQRQSCMLCCFEANNSFNRSQCIPHTT